jgi:hypothetical protein
MEAAMHHAIIRTWLYAAGIEPNPWTRPPTAPRRRTRTTLARLLLAAGGFLLRAGGRLLDERISQID